MLSEVTSFNQSNKSADDSTVSRSSQPSVAREINNYVTTTIHSLQFNTARLGWRWYIGTLIPQIIYLWCVIFMPTARNYNWGSVGSIIFDILNFPSTFFVHWLGYMEGTIITCLIIAFVALCYLVWMISLWATNNAHSHTSKVKAILYLFGIISQTFSIFFMFAMAGFYDCSRTRIITETLELTLNRFPSMSCSGSQNTVLMALSIVATLGLFMFVLFSRLVTHDLHPLSFTPLVASHPYILVLLDIISMLGLVGMFAIPIEYSYAAITFNTLLSLLFLLLTVKSCPFFRRMDNSLMVGVGCARLGACVGTLVNFIVNPKQDLYLGIEIGVVLTLGLVICGFVGGFLATEAYLFFIIKSVRGRIMEAIAQHIDNSPQGVSLYNNKKAILTLLDNKALVIFQEMKEENRLSHLRSFFKFCNKSSFATVIAGLKTDEGDDIVLTEKDLVLTFSKVFALRKSTDTDLLYYAALLMGYDHRNEGSFNTTQALELMNRVSKNTKNSLFRMIVEYRVKELQHYAAELHTVIEADANEADSKVQSVKLAQEILVSLHRDFFKEMISDPVKTSSLEKITKKITEVVSECDQLYKELLVNKKNTTYLRMYASYVENFQFDKELAQTIIMEASQMEEEQRLAQFVSFRKNSLSKQNNQLVPTNDSMRCDSNMSSNKKYKLSTENPHTTVNEQDSKAQEILDNLESASSVGFEYEQKKDFLFRNALKTRVSNTIQFFSFYLYIIMCIALIIGGIVLHIVDSAQIKNNIVNLRFVCMPQTTPLSVMRNIRSMQNFVNIFLNYEYDWPLYHDGHSLPSKKEYVNYFFERVSNDKTILHQLIELGQAVQFDAVTYTEYGKSMYTTYVPGFESSSGMGKTFTGTPQPRNVSIIEITNSILKYSEQIINEDFPGSYLSEALNMNSLNTSAGREMVAKIMNSTFMGSVSSFNFMYLWINKLDFSDIYEGFCNRYVEKSKDGTRLLMLHSQIYFFVSLGLSCVIGLILNVIIFQNQMYFRRLMKLLERQTTKEMIGKIYHTLSKKTSVEASLDTTVASKAFKSKYAPLVVICFLSLLVPLCVGLFYLETFKNAKNALFTFTNVGLSANVIEHMQRNSFYLGELLTNFGLKNYVDTIDVKYGSKYLSIAKTIDELYSLIRYETDMVAANWNELIYGDVTKPDDDPVIGLYPSLDKLLKSGVAANCTEYLASHNLTLNLKTSIQYCLGIEKVMTDYLTETTEVCEHTRNAYLNQLNSSKNMDPTEIFMEHNLVSMISYPLSDKLVIYMNEFIRVSGELSLVLLLVFSSCGLLLTLVFGKVLHSMLKNAADHYQQTRILLNYIPTDFVDRNETLRNLILYHQFPNPIMQKFSNRRIHPGSSDDEGSVFKGVSNIINSNVDGSAIINAQGEVELCNPSALRMFGLSSVDILGNSIYSLFSPGECQTQVKKVVGSLFEQSKRSSDGSAHELFEAECVRRNNSKFPARLTLFTTHFSEKRTVIVMTIKDMTSEKKQQTLLNEEKKNSENLLKNILPEAVGNRLKQGETFIAEKLGDITCFFSDMVGFTNLSSNMQPTELVQMLNTIVNGFDSLVEMYRLEKIKTIGDAYFAVGGLHGAASSDHPEQVLRFSMDTFKVIRDFNDGKYGMTLEGDQLLNIRVGINTGRAVAGVIGKIKFAYDLWGDTINIASRMESTGVPGRIQISRSTYERVYDLGFEFEERHVDVKGKGLMQSYLLKAKYHTNPLPELKISNNANNAMMEDEIHHHNHGHIEQHMLSNSLEFSTIRDPNAVESDKHNDAE
ncbi:hypothetical protein C9374_003461 [Naegleria lovaniensis]|uniref:Adenylate and Guanylate cyclase catalytic domain containing protein n=1 Tax=Naegleria lovaniensis TaxID=51637 RepID=A0AA88KLS5_NAELO|nr:uncharacterized protein C9374_003461 [Naegleria lovaniensis]KAG2385646.1 hypothetical protein C9374_003461 [Naegleria lovaniensis]